MEAYWRPHSLRLREHVRRFGDLPVVVRRASGHAVRLGGRSAALGEQEWRAYARIAEAGGDRPGMAALREACDRRLAELAAERDARPVDLRFTDLNGQPVDLAAMRGQVVLLDFWATWCGPCVAEMPFLKELGEQYGPRGLRLIGISADGGTKQQLQVFLARHGYDRPQHFDGKGTRNEIAVAFGVASYPTTYLIGRDGRVIKKNVRGAELEAAIREALDLETAEESTD